MDFEDNSRGYDGTLFALHALSNYILTFLQMLLTSHAAISVIDLAHLFQKVKTEMTALGVLHLTGVKRWTLGILNTNPNKTASANAFTAAYRQILVSRTMTKTPLIPAPTSLSQAFIHDCLKRMFPTFSQNTDRLRNVILCGTHILATLAASAL